MLFINWSVIFWSKAHPNPSWVTVSHGVIYLILFICCCLFCPLFIHQFICGWLNKCAVKGPPEWLSIMGKFIIYFLSFFLLFILSAIYPSIYLWVVGEMRGQRSPAVTVYHGAIYYFSLLWSSACRQCALFTSKHRYFKFHFVLFGCISERVPSLNIHWYVRFPLLRWM